MLCLVDAHVFGNARLERVARLDFPAEVKFLERETIRSVAVDLVRRGENEGRFRAIVSRRFEEIEGPIGVDREIHLRIARRPVVRRLGRSVNDRGQFAPVGFEDFVYRTGIANVDLMMLVRRQARLERVARLAGGCFLAEEARPHVVIEPDDAAAIGRETFDRLRADQSSRAGNKNGARFCHPVRCARQSSRSTPR